MKTLEKFMLLSVLLGAVLVVGVACVLGASSETQETLSNEQGTTESSDPAETRREGQNPALEALETPGDERGATATSDPADTHQQLQNPPPRELTPPEHNTIQGRADPPIPPDTSQLPVPAPAHNAPIAPVGPNSGDSTGPGKPDPSQAQTGIWISQSEIDLLPTTGPAWTRLKISADREAGTPDLSDQNQHNNVWVLAKALVFARTGQESYRSEIRSQLAQAIDTELGGRTLALGRELGAYVIAADLIDLPSLDPAFDQDHFRPWLRRTLTENLSGKTLQSTHEDRPNNWGTLAGGSRVAVAVYLGDDVELARAARVFKGWLGDNETYGGVPYTDGRTPPEGQWPHSGFRYGCCPPGVSLEWQCDKQRLTGINPKGCTRNGHSIDGVLPDDQHRATVEFVWPPPKESYVWEGLQGALMQAEILYRAGYTRVYDWEDQALLRAVQWLHDQANYPARGDDPYTWEVHLYNYRYNKHFPTQTPKKWGRNMDFTDWTHGPGRVDLPASSGNFPSP
ncbi:MAG: alginate lyase family protein [Dehalococcoidia bacterium]